MNDREAEAGSGEKLCTLLSSGETVCVPVGGEAELPDEELRERHEDMQRILHESERVYAAHDIFRVTRAYLTVQAELLARMDARLAELEDSPDE